MKTIITLAASVIIGTSVSFAILLPNTIIFSALPDKTYGDVDFAISATSDNATVTPAIVFSATGQCSIVSLTNVHITGAGSCTITADQAADATYDAAAPVSQTFAIAKKDITISGGDFAAASKVYDGTTAALLNAVPTGVMFFGVAGLDVVTLDTTNASGTLVDKNIASGTPVTFAGYALDALSLTNYNLTNQPSPETQDVNTLSLTITGVTASNKVYDGTDAATSAGVPALVGVVASDTANVTLGGSMFLNFSGLNPASVGIAKPVTVTGLNISGSESTNYTLIQPTLSANISAKELTVSGLSASDKVYNQNLVATITGTPVLVGTVSADVLPTAISLSGVATGSFANKDVGAAKLVTISGLSLTGTSVGNYIFISPTSTATITPATLNVTASGTSKVYDGLTSTNVTYTDDRFLGDIFTVNGTANLDDKNVGVTKLVTVTGVNLSGTDANNYALATSTLTTTGSVTKKDMTVTAVSSSKVYDANVTASTTLSSIDKVALDTVTYNRTSSTFADKNVGVAKLVTTGGISITGTDAGNYNLLNSTTTSNADITARALVVTAVAQNKVYDATTTAAISSLSSDVISGDTIGTLASASANFSDKNVGTAKLVTVDVVITPAIDNTNYTIPTVSTTTANITVRTLTVTASGTSKVYDGNTIAPVVFTDDRLAGDVFTATSSSSTFANKNVGTGKAVTVTGVSVVGTDAANYVVTPNSLSTTGDITAKAATIIAENKSKVYGTADPALTATTTGLVTGDTLTGALVRVAGENVGTYDITAGTITAGANYTTTFATGTFTIVKADQVITISPVSNKNPEDPAFNIVATTTSGLPITFSLGIGTNVCTLATSTVTLTGATGTCTIVADQAGDMNYNPASSTSIVINVLDTHAPIITLNGSSTINLFVNGSYTELGAIASDFVDGTSTAVVSGDVVNTNLAGTYVIKYNATDTAGNIATEVTRQVIVSNIIGIVFPSSGGSSSGSFGGVISVNPNTNNNTGVVLGASKFRFLKNLKLGVKNDDVKELQKVLASLNLYTGKITGVFDNATFKAVKSYQKANKIISTGYFGPLTRAVINK